MLYESWLKSQDTKYSPYHANSHTVAGPDTITITVAETTIRQAEAPNQGFNAMRSCGDQGIETVLRLNYSFVQ